MILGVDHRRSRQGVWTGWQSERGFVLERFAGDARSSRPRARKGAARYDPAIPDLSEIYVEALRSLDARIAEADRPRETAPL
jgi:hypothetical protein